jgi:predicted heme/steroid binding protein
MAKVAREMVERAGVDKVYDVSQSFLWQGGRHLVLHTAGADLTSSLDQAPHGADLLERVRFIGILDGS